MGKRQSKMEGSGAAETAKSGKAGDEALNEKPLDQNVHDTMSDDIINVTADKKQEPEETQQVPGVVGVTNTKQMKDGVAYEVVINQHGSAKKPNLHSPAKVKEVCTKEAVLEKLAAAYDRKMMIESERQRRLAEKSQRIREVQGGRYENVEQKTKEVAEKLEEKMKATEAKQEAARIAQEKQRQAKQEHFKDVLQTAHEKKEILVKTTEEKLQLKIGNSAEKRDAHIKSIIEQQQARFKKIELAKNYRAESEQCRFKDLEDKTQQKFMTAREVLEAQERARQVKFEAEEERLRRAKIVTEEKLEAEVKKKAEKAQQKMEKYRENYEAQKLARLEKLRADELHREEVRLKKERNLASQG